jgi:hypothetical protein
VTKGASGDLPKTLPAHDLVSAIEAIADGKSPDELADDVFV